MAIVDNPDRVQLVRKAAAGVELVNLYDPPIDGETPLNGAGEPRTSLIPERDVVPKLAQGFTREPVLPEPAAEEMSASMDKRHQNMVEKRRAKKR